MLRKGTSSPGIAFGLAPSWAVQGDSVYWGLGDNPEYAVLDPTGEIVRIVRWHAAPEPITAED